MSDVATERRLARKARYEMCAGCNNLKSKMQARFREDDGTPIPRCDVMMPFCTYYGLHLESAEQVVIKTSETTPYCDKYNNE